MTLANIQADSKTFLAHTRLANVTDQAGQRWLSIPGHDPHIIRALKHRRDPLEIRITRRSNRDFYEETTTLLISFLTGYFKTSTFFDLGASTGYFAFVAASHAHTRPRAHAFEMQPYLIEMIDQTARERGLSDRVVSHLTGLSDVHRGRRRIWYARTKMFETEPAPGAYLEPWWIRMKFALQGGQTERGALNSAEVLLTSLDRFCSDNAVSPDLIKIDVDGYEGKVLRGAKHLLSDTQPVILLELHKDAKQRDGISRTNCVGMLFAAGYRALFVTDHQDLERCKLVEARPDDPLFERQQTDMVLFIPPKWL